MTNADGDHFAYPIARAHPVERHLGLPTRTRLDEDRAQEARAGARTIRAMLWLDLLAQRRGRVEMPMLRRSR